MASVQEIQFPNSVPQHRGGGGGGRHKGTEPQHIYPKGLPARSTPISSCASGRKPQKNQAKGQAFAPAKKAPFKPNVPRTECGNGSVEMQVCSKGPVGPESF